MTFKNLLLGATFLFAITGCDSPPGSVSKLTGSTDSSSTSPNMCTSPTTKVIDYGKRVIAGTPSARGNFSDIELIPTLNYPAVVYTDAGAVALKYKFWDGTAYKTEIIAGGLTTNFVKLVFLPSGRPLVFWANGATAIYMASRSTESTTESGTWTVTIIDDIATMTTRAVEASVNAAGQVAVFYISAASTLARIILCSANCETASNYGSMGVIGNFISAAASATGNSPDVKWCNAGGGTYYPYVAFPGSVNSLIARCTSATLSDCLVPGNWASAIITDGTAILANQNMTKMHIDNSVDAPFAVVARRGGADIRAYTQTAGGCSTGALSFTAAPSIIVAGANLGNAFGSLKRDSANRWHLVVNDSTTSMRYFNETTGTITAAWNNTLGTIETATLPAAGAGRGGMVIDETRDQFLATYGRTSTTSAQNIVVASNQCRTGAPATCLTTTLESPSNATGMAFGSVPFDTTGQMLLPTVAQSPNSIATAATSTGIPAIAYSDFSAASSILGKLKYAFRNGTSTSDNWLIREIDSATSPQAVALAFDHNNKPWIAYHDAAGFRYYLMTNSQTDGSDVWKTYQFPVTSPGGSQSGGAANNVALAMAYSAGVAKPVMIISSNHNLAGSTKFVKSAVFDPDTLTWSENQFLENSVFPMNNLTLSADYDKSGNIVLAFYDVDTSNAALLGKVRYTYSSDGGVTWNAAAATSAAIVSGVNGIGVSIKINPLTSKPAIAFFDQVNDVVRYKYCTTAISSCIDPANWSDVGAGTLATAGIASFAVTQTGILNSSLTFGSDGTPLVVFPTGVGATNPGIMMSYQDSTTGLFSTPAALSTGFNANVTSPVAITPVNFSTGGWQPSSVRTSTGSLHTAYIGPGNYLYVTSCGN